jgi:hypothetical protein
VSEAEQTRTARAAVVLRAGEHQAEVCFGSETGLVGYAAPFGARAQSLTPGHLVAVADTPDAGPLVLWRWYDAVVLEQLTDHVRLWEPGHGEVLATPRDPVLRYPPGTRAYASAGMPGADWWIEGPVAAVEDVDVALDEVCAFYAEHGLWERLV